MKLPAGGLAACNRGNTKQSTTSWGDFDDDDWVPFWDLENTTTTTSVGDNITDEIDGVITRRKRELEKEEGLFGPLYSKNITIHYIHNITADL